jgi:hypothetical protein
MKKETFAINEENIEYVPNIRIYNVKISMKCLNCGRPLIEVEDPIIKRKTGHCFKCKCFSKNTIISIG